MLPSNRRLLIRKYVLISALLALMLRYTSTNMGYRASVLSFFGQCCTFRVAGGGTKRKPLPNADTARFGAQFDYEITVLILHYKLVLNILCMT